MATSPATAPVVAPSAVGFPWWAHSMKAQVSPAVAAAVFVTTNAMDASPLAPNALPALKPNQPNHRRDAPMTVRVRLWGGVTALGYPRRRPTRMAATSAETPELMWTAAGRTRGPRSPSFPRRRSPGGPP